jgi:acyl dehydratase
VTMRFQDVQEGDFAPELRVVMERERYFAYNALVKNINPLHSDRAYARTLGFDDVVVAGVYTYSFMTRVVEDWVGGDGRISSVEISYQHPVLIGESVIYTARVARKEERDRGLELEVQAKNTAGAICTRAAVRVVFS